MGEKLMKRLMRLGAPDSRAIRAGRENFHIHMDYCLADRTSQLAGRRRIFHGRHGVGAHVLPRLHQRRAVGRS